MGCGLSDAGKLPGEGGFRSEGNQSLRDGSPGARGAQSWQPQPRLSVPLVSGDLEGLRPWDFSPLDLTPASGSPLVVSSM